MTLVPPLRGLPSEARLGVVSNLQFCRSTMQLQTWDNPQPRKLGSPLKGGTRGAVQAFSLRKHGLDKKPDGEAIRFLCLGDQISTV